MKTIYIDNKKVTDFRVEKRGQPGGWVTLYVNNNSSAHSVPADWLDNPPGACYTGGHRYSHHPATNP